MKNREEKSIKTKFVKTNYQKTLWLMGIMIMIMLIPIFSLANSVDSKNIELFVEDFVNSMSNEENKWSEETRIENITPLHNLDATINGYIVELCTEELSAGYILINKVNDFYDPVMWSYEGDFYLSNFDLFNQRAEVTQKIYNFGLGNYLVKMDNGEFRTIDSNRVVHMAEIQELSNNYSEQKNLLYKSNMTTEHQSDYSVMNTEYRMDLKRLYGNPNATGGLRYNFLPVLMKDFKFSLPGGRCVSIATLNMLRYWTAREGIKNLLVNDYNKTFDLLDKEIGVLPIVHGQFGRLGYQGTKSYISKYNRTAAKGSDYALNVFGIWDYLDQNIRSNNPVVLGLDKTGQYNNQFHAVLAVGTHKSNGYSFARICDGWTTNLSTFVQTKFIIDAWYLRW